VNVSFGFMGEGEFKAEIWKDSPDSDKVPANLINEELFNFNSQYNKELSLAPGGGFVMHISPE
jgi:hypothetical protein